MNRSTVSLRQAFGPCRRLRAQADANLAALARVVQAEPGLRVAEHAGRLKGSVTWRNPEAAIRQHMRSGLGTLRRLGLVCREGRLWVLEQDAGRPA